MISFDVREILDRYNIEYTSIHGTTELFYYCPFHIHSDQNMGSSRINEDTGVYNCFACKEGGNIYKFVSLLEKVSVNEAYNLVKNDFKEQPSYDLEKLKKRQVRILSLTASYNKLADNIVSKLLNKLISVGNRDFKHKWLIICNYIKSTPVEGIDKKHNELLDIYLEFNKELKLL